eukprot:m.640545 g.640545  ORF g.640545 m.640545 type:complete len:101 (-) comp22622_c0_seq6:2300-2602(-)
MHVAQLKSRWKATVFAAQTVQDPHGKCLNRQQHKGTHICHHPRLVEKRREDPVQAAAASVSAKHSKGECNCSTVESTRGTCTVQVAGWYPDLQATEANSL